MQGAHPRIRSAAILLITALAFLCQSLVIQSHFHPVRAAHAAAPIEVGAESAHQVATLPDADQPPCPICQEMALAGAYLPATAVTFHAPGPFALWREITPSLELAPRQRSHGWQSRAPPRRLQA